MAKDNRKPGSLRRGESPSRLSGVYEYKSWAANWRVWLNIVLLFLVLEIAVLSVEKAHWITPQPSLTMVLIFSVLVTWLLARSRLPVVVVHILGVLAGLLVTIWQTNNLINAPDIASGLSRMITALQSLAQAAGTAPTGTENLSFIIFLVLITWLAGYVSTWFLVRRQNAWAGVALGALVILVNLSNLTDSYYLYLGCYLLAAVLSIAHSRMMRQPHPHGYSRGGWMYLGAALLCIVILASSIAWFTPEVRTPQLETYIATRTLWKKGVEDSGLNIFNTVPSKQAISTSGTHREQAFEGTWHQGEQINFIVRSARPSYWRVHIYDVYTSHGWENSPSSEYLLEQKAPWGGGEIAPGPGGITYTVSVDLKTDIMLMAGSFISSDNPSLVEVSAGDVIAVRTPRIFRPGEEYAVTSRISSPSPGSLAGTGGGYPQAIIDYYLQLPPGLPQSVRQLSKDITINAAIPYEKVLAINKYLAKYPYEANIEAPPKNTDAVAYFLFEKKSGYCLYYASAMAVMLRSLGVPARLAVGYLPGEPGSKAGEYILKDKHSHAWPQVYFSGYGWVDLEATPGGGGSGVAIETPWVSDEAIAQLPEWDVWLTSPLLETPETLDENTAAVSGNNTDVSGVFAFANELGLALVVILATALILVVLLIPVLILRSSFYRRVWYVNRANLASIAYDKMCYLAAMVRLGPRPQQTPLEFAGELAAVFPEQASAFDHIARSYVENRFGRRGNLGLFEEAELLKARCRAFGAILEQVNLAGRLSRGRY